MKSGIIICCYPGVVQDDLCKRYKKFINFNSFIDDDNKNSYVEQFCNDLIKLKEQGYIIFTTTDIRVRSCLENNNVQYYCIFPSINLKKEWFNKLKHIFFENTSMYNYKAVEQMIENFEDDIFSLNQETNKIELTSIDFDLIEIISNIEAELNRQEN